MPPRDVLLRIERNDFARVLRARNLALEDFEWVVSTRAYDHHIVVTHRPTHRSVQLTIRGRKTAVADARTFLIRPDDWQGVRPPPLRKTWFDCLKDLGYWSDSVSDSEIERVREESAADLWADAFSGRTHAQDDSFTPEQRVRVRRGLQEVERGLVREGRRADLKPAQFEHLSACMRDLSDRLETLSRFDWKRYFAGVLTSLVTMVAVDPDAARALLLESIDAIVGTVGGLLTVLTLIACA